MRQFIRQSEVADISLREGWGSREKVLELDFVFRPDRPDQDALRRDVQLLFQASGIRLDGEAPGAPGRGQRDAHPRVQRNDPVLVGKQWVDVEFRDLVYVGEQLRNAHQDSFDRLAIRGPTLAV